MDNNPVAIAIISDYMEAKNAPKEQKHQQSGGSARAQPVVPPRQQSHPSSYSASLAAAAKPPPAQQVAAAKQEKDKWLNLGGAQPPTVEELSADTTKVSQQMKHSAILILSVLVNWCAVCVEKSVLKRLMWLCCTEVHCKDH